MARSKNIKLAEDEMPVRRKEQALLGTQTGILFHYSDGSSHTHMHGQK